MSGFLNHCNGAEGIHNFGDLFKDGHVRQTMGGTGQAPVPIPPLKQTNLKIKYFEVFASIMNVNPMQREFGDLQNLFAWDLDNIYIIGNT